MKSVLTRCARILAVLATGLTFAVGVSSTPAQAATPCYGGIFYCVKSQKFANFLTGADIGLAPIAQQRFTNYTSAPIKHVLTVRVGTAISWQATGSLTFGGKVGTSDLTTSLGVSATHTASTDVTSVVEATLKPGETWLMQCYGYYAKYEVALYQRVPGYDNDLLLGAQYYYPPSANSLYCRAFRTA